VAVRDADRLRNLLSVANLFLHVPPRMRGGGDIFKRLSKLASSACRRISSSYRAIKSWLCPLTIPRGALDILNSLKHSRSPAITTKVDDNISKIEINFRWKTFGEDPVVYRSKKYSPRY
jgi:hypothetical protein